MKSYTYQANKKETLTVLFFIFLPSFLLSAAIIWNSATNHLNSIQELFSAMGLMLTGLIFIVSVVYFVITEVELRKNKKTYIKELTELLETNIEMTYKGKSLVYSMKKTETGYCFTLGDFDFLKVNEYENGMEIEKTNLYELYKSEINEEELFQKIIQKIEYLNSKKLIVNDKEIYRETIPYENIISIETYENGVRVEYKDLNGNIKTDNMKIKQIVNTQKQIEVESDGENITRKLLMPLDTKWTFEKN